MIMSYIQPGLIARWRVNPSLLIPIEQMRQVTSGPHRQPVRNPTDRDRGFGSQPGSQPHLERMALAPGYDLLGRHRQRSSIPGGRRDSSRGKSPQGIGCAACEP